MTSPHPGSFVNAIKNLHGQSSYKQVCETEYDVLKNKGDGKLHYKFKQ